MIESIRGMVFEKICEYHKELGIDSFSYKIAKKAQKWFEEKHQGDNDVISS